MKLLHVALAAASILSVSGCQVRETTTVDVHRQWWVEHHSQEAYESERAEREHREWCRHTPDRSCEGWR